MSARAWVVAIWDLELTPLTDESAETAAVRVICCPCMIWNGATLEPSVVLGAVVSPCGTGGGAGFSTLAWVSGLLSD